jgi:hypothetical protein
MLNPSAACSALEPRPALLVPRYQNGIPVDQNVRGVSGELAPPVATQGEPSDRPFRERANAVEFESIEAEPALDQTVGGEAWVVLIVEQSEGTGHRCENNTVL